MVNYIFGVVSFHCIVQKYLTVMKLKTNLTPYKLPIVLICGTPVPRNLVHCREISAAIRKQYKIVVILA